MKLRFVPVALLAFVLINNCLAWTSEITLAPKTDPKELLRRSLEAMGGQRQLLSLKSLQFEGLGHIFAVEQSERPEGPWLTHYVQTGELRDLINRRIRLTNHLRSGQTAQWSTSPQIVRQDIEFVTGSGV